GGAFRLAAPRGVRRALAGRGAVPDRLSDGGAPAVVGRWNARAAAPDPAWDRAGPDAAPSRQHRSRGTAELARRHRRDRRAGVRSPLRRASRRGPRGGEWRPVRIAVLAPVWFPVPPTGYGGIEWVVWLLADGLVDAGHEVTLFASGDSTTKAQLVSVYDIAPSELIGTSVVEIHHCLACFERAADFDVINDH